MGGHGNGATFLGALCQPEGPEMYSGQPADLLLAQTIQRGGLSTSSARSIS